MSAPKPDTVAIRSQRTYGAAPNWLLTIDIDQFHGGPAAIGAYPQARAVVDDFGTLVIVRRWL